MDLLLKKIAEHYALGLPFALFSLPEGDSITAYFQRDATLYSTSNFLEKSLVLAPFDYNRTALCMPFEACDVQEVDIPEMTLDANEVSVLETSEEKEHHINLVKKMVSTISKGPIGKIVASRCKELPLKSDDFIKIIPGLFSLQPRTFRYVWFHPETGMWCGSSPELLIQAQKDAFSTMSLAGTRKVSETLPVWTNKERVEQQMVTDAITTSLQRVTSVMKLSKTYNHVAGSLVHLRTDISGMLRSTRATLAGIVSVLHPTPAVCGTPQKMAKKFILNWEGYKREFYTGFIGPVQQDTATSQLFVNLRCMKIQNKKAYLYVGGGITANSIPEDEWKETHFKLQTMLQVLRPLL